jgi:hypothetical protein
MERRENREADRETGQDTGREPDRNSEPAGEPGADGSGKADERRQTPRFSLEENAKLTLLCVGEPASCKVLDVSLDGCQLRAQERFSASIGMRVEVTFRVNGIAFRMSGAIQWTDGWRMVGIRFVEMTLRRTAEWAEVIREVEEDLAARAALRQVAERQAALVAAEAASKPKAEPSALPPAKRARRERRGETRHEVDTSAILHLVHGGTQITGRILDLSPEGCRIRTDEKFPVGIYTRVEMEFRLAGQALRLGGVVQAIYDARHDAPLGKNRILKRREVGLRFLDLSPRKQEELRQLIDEIEQMRAQQVVSGS